MKLKKIRKAVLLAFAIMAIAVYSNGSKAQSEGGDGSGKFYRIAWVYCIGPFGIPYDGPGCITEDPNGSCDRKVDCI